MSGPTEQRVTRRVRMLSAAGPAAAVAALVVYGVVEIFSDIDDYQHAAAVVATFFGTFGALAGAIGGSALHAFVGVNAGMVAAAVWWIVALGGGPLVTSEEILAGYLGLIGAWTAFGALFGLADRREAHVALGACSGALAGAAFPFAWMAVVFWLLALPFRRETWAGFAGGLAVAVASVAGMLALVGNELFLPVMLVAGSYPAAVLFFSLIRDRSRIVRVAGDEAGDEAGGEAAHAADPTDDDAPHDSAPAP